jgi:sulfite reductase (NADPH) flavoprotein alpha-component
MGPIQLAQQLNDASAPLSAEQVNGLQKLISSLNPIQQSWVSGYLAASANIASINLPSIAPSAAKEAQLTILYGSQSGNAKSVACDLKAKAEARGLAVQLVNMADYKPNQLKNEKHLAIVVSTYGEGEPPEDAESLHEFLVSKKAPNLNELEVSVLGLGDSSYQYFCQTAIDFDQRLTALGAKTALARVDLDIDYEASSTTWITRVLDVFEPALKAKQQNANVIPMSSFTASSPSTSLYSKNNPFTAELLSVQKITGRDSSKDIRHVEISLAGSDLTYQPGDALGVYFLNDEQRISALLEQVKLTGEEEIKLDGKTYTVKQVLIEKLELTKSYPSFVEQYAHITGNVGLLEIIEDKNILRAYLEPRQIFDVIAQNPAEIDAQALVDCLRPIQPRLYSIASSQAEVDDEVHLTVALVSYHAFDELHQGSCSSYLSHRIEEGADIQVFVEQNNHFRLPADDKPIIMIGPGTGIAPFRAFLQEREARSSVGKNWLFFGNPHFTQDFLYQVEIQNYLKSGLLTHVDVAFSRDQTDKVYVQDRMKERGKELFEWLESGAHIYVCGDANRMAKDVHQTLLEIIQAYGGRSAEQADDYLKELRIQKRYQKDVY